MGSWIELLSNDRVQATIAASGALVGVMAAMRERRARKILGDRLRRVERQLSRQETEIKDKQLALEQREATIAERQREIDSVRLAVLKSDEQLWELYDPRPFAAFHSRISERRPLVITIGNLKGGVGKTTLAANLAADWAIAGKKRVLLIDLDYQGSLSTMLFSAAGLKKVPSQVEAILDGTIQAGDFHTAASNLSLQMPALSTTWLIPAYYSLAARENQLMLDWLLNSGGDDVRYRLARFLFDDHVRDMIDVVIVDTPPRLTTGSVNALCASTHFLVPSRLDKLSAETVGGFVNAVKKLKNQVNPGLEFIGVVGTMTAQQQKLTPVEADSAAMIEEQLEYVWPQRPHIFSRHIPNRAAFAQAAGQQIAYLQDAAIRQLVNELGEAIRARVAQ